MLLTLSCESAATVDLQILLDYINMLPTIKPEGKVCGGRYYSVEAITNCQLLIGFRALSFA